MKQAGTCRHFNGIGLRDDDKRCDAGVNYREHVGGPNLGWCLRMPCVRVGGINRDPSEVVECDLYEEPSSEEIAESNAELQRLLDRIEMTIPLIERIKREHRGEIWTGTEPCPVCGAKLSLSHSAINGHVCVKCETDGCVSWVE